MQKVFAAEGAEQTVKAGMDVAGLLKIGDVVALKGDLGAGKTVFTKGIAAGLGITDAVSSPTYTIVHEYSGRLPLYHFDAYRISSVEEMEDVGYYDYINDGVCVIEWAELIEEILPVRRISVNIEKTGENSRRIVVDIPGCGR